MNYEKDHQYILTVTNLDDFKHKRIKLNFLDGRPELVYLNKKISDLKIIFDKYFVHDVTKVMTKNEFENFQTYLTILFLSRRYTRSNIKDCQSGKVTLDEVLIVLKERFPGQNEENWIKTIHGEKYRAEILNELIQRVKLAEETKVKKPFEEIFDWKKHLLPSTTILRFIKRMNLKNKNKESSIKHKNLSPILNEELFNQNLKNIENIYSETLDQIDTKVTDYMKNNMIETKQVEEYFLNKGYEIEVINNFFETTKSLNL